MQGKAAMVAGALGFVFVLGGAVGLNHWHQRAIESERNRLSTPVLVALRGLNQGEAMGPLDFRMRDWPSESLPEGAITDQAGMEGRVLTASVQAGEPIVMSKLAPVGALTGLVQRISQGHRAISLKVTDASAVNGFIQPGHKVDIVAYLPGSAASGLSALGRQQAALTRTLIEDVLVMAVDREAQSENGRPKSSSVVTLELLASDIERLEHARQIGSVSLVLRADGDAGLEASRGQTSTSLWRPPARAREITKPKAPPEVQVATNAAHTAQAPHCIEVFEGLKPGKECLP